MATPLRRVNILLADFLSDLNLVFPDELRLAQAKALVDCAVNIDNTSPIPLLFFLSNHDLESAKDNDNNNNAKDNDNKNNKDNNDNKDNKNNKDNKDNNANDASSILEFPRAFLGITSEHWGTLYESCSPQNKKTIDAYLGHIEHACLGALEASRHVVAQQKVLAQSDVVLYLRKITEDAKTCDELLNEPGKMEALFEKISALPLIMDLARGVEFVVSRGLKSPQLLFRLTTLAQEFMESTDDSDSDPNSSASGGGAALLSSLATMASLGSGAAGGDDGGSNALVATAIKALSAGFSDQTDDEAK